MPQIAQQDYKIIKPTLGRPVTADAAALAELKKAFLNGTIYDCIIESPIVPNSGDGRVLGTLSPNFTIYVTNPDDSGNPGTINFPFTTPQYQGLAAVQAGIDEYTGAISTDLPTLYTGYDDVHLAEVGNDILICVGGKYLTPTVSNNKIQSITIAETGPSSDNVINITWEDAQKLIGLPCSTD